MKHFKSRLSQSYVKTLKSYLAVDGPNGVKERAIPLAKPFEFPPQNGIKYHHCVRIDFLGIAASTLFDTGNLVSSLVVHEELVNLMKHAEELNEEGYFIRLRILLAYPYSTGSYSRIQAEASSDRSSIEEPKFARNFRFVEQVDQSIFQKSVFVNTQSITLGVLQETIENLQQEAPWGSEDQNRAYVRFLPQDPKMCCLFINDTVFYDVYLLSKEKRRSNKCTYLLSPIINVNKSDGLVFDAFEDHFRYLWELDITMDCDDATAYQPGKKDSLGIILPPTSVTFKTKAERIRAKNKGLTEEESAIWKFSAQSILRKFCLDLSPAPATHSLFITCSWTRQGGEPATPNEKADTLFHSLTDDFSTTKEAGTNQGLFSVKIMEASKGKFLASQLYQNLQNSTLGLVLITRDIKCDDGTWMAKPNVFHELGYLMRQLGSERVAIVAEKDVVIPTNIHDIVRTTFEKDKINLVYHEIVKWLYDSLVINKTHLAEAFERNKERLQGALEGSVIEASELKKVKKEMKKILKEINEQSPPKVR